MDREDRDSIIFNAGFKAGKEHSTPSPETARRLKVVETILYVEAAVFIIAGIALLIRYL